MEDTILGFCRYLDLFRFLETFCNFYFDDMHSSVVAWVKGRIFDLFFEHLDLCWNWSDFDEELSVELKSECTIGGYSRPDHIFYIWSRSYGTCSTILTDQGVVEGRLWKKCKTQFKAGSHSFPPSATSALIKSDWVGFSAATSAYLDYQVTVWEIINFDHI